MSSESVQNEFERPFVVSKGFLDTANSLTWFLADGFWMIDAVNVGFIFMGFTIISGACLMYIDKRKDVLFINVGLMCWIFMNTFWMLSDVSDSESYLFKSQICFFAGLVFIAIAATISKSLRETFSHFRRFRVLK